MILHTYKPFRLSTSATEKVEKSFAPMNFSSKTTSGTSLSPTWAATTHTHAEHANANGVYEC